MSRRTVHVIKHLRRTPDPRDPLTVSTPHPRQFAKPRTPVKQDLRFVGPRVKQPHPRRQMRPRQHRLVGIKAPLLEDYGVLIDQPRPVVFKPKFEPAVYFGEKGRVELRGGQIDGIARGKEKFLLVRRDAKGKDEIHGKAIFKPASGEPNWEYDYGIPEGQQYIRESVMSQLNDILGWKIVPPTAIREIDGQIGSVQQWISEAKTLWDFQRGGRNYNEVDYLKIATLDLISGNVDRHRGNILVESDGKLWAIDHGGAFPSELGQFNVDAIANAKDKEIPREIKRALRALDEGDLRAALAPLLLGGELGFMALEQAVNRWKWLKGLKNYPGYNEFRQHTENAAKLIKKKPRKPKDGAEMPEIFNVAVEERDEDDNEGDEDDQLYCDKCHEWSFDEHSHSSTPSSSSESED